MAEKVSRRDFLGTTAKGAAAVAAFTVVPPSVLGQKVGKTAPSDKLNIAGVGVGGRGASVLRGCETENIVALCDTDWHYSQKTVDKYPGARRFWDFRVMFDQMAQDIDAVIVATADHTHAIVASDAMTLGKHVYVEKPLTHTVYESRLLTRLAEKHQLATQMGNQGSSDAGVRQTCDWLWSGAIGEVIKVEAWTNRPIWPQGLNRPAQADPLPNTLNWDLFIGPAKMRPYNAIYQPWNWRGWWDFGTGALGDMACHILHPVFKALKLGYPTKAIGSSTALLTDCAPTAQKVKMVFPARGTIHDLNLPEVEVYWYDGGLLPFRLESVPDGKMVGDPDGGLIFHGTKDTLICGCYGRDPWLVSGRTPNAPGRSRVVPDGPLERGKHQQDWIRACKESPATRVKSASDFSEAGPFNEMVVMGVLAVRLQALNKELQWDGENMRFTNIGPDETLKIMIEDGFSIQDGHPTFKKTFTDPINAQEFANELIKHTYRDGWKLVNMPG